MAKTAFVTGATGFVGLNLVEQLCAAGWQICALHRAGSDLTWLGRFPARRVLGDITDADSIMRAMPEGVDAVFHVAANTSVWSRRNAEQTRDNVEGTRNVVAAALARGARRLVHTSTWNTFGLDYDRIDETLPQRGGQSWINYNRSKWLAEQEVRAGIGRGLDAIIVNPSHVMGRYDRGNWSRIIVMVHERRLPGIPPGAGSFCHSVEVAKAHIAAAEHGRRAENYLLGGADASFVELVGLIGRIANRKVPSRPVPAMVLRALARAQTLTAAFTGREPDLTPEGVAMVQCHPRIVSTKAAKELGYRPATLESMIQDSYRWLLEAGIIQSD